MERAEARAMHRHAAAQPLAGRPGMSVSNGEAREQRQGILWRLQGLLRKREAESVRDRMEELIEEHEELPRDSDGRGQPDEFSAQERAVLGNVLKLRDKTADDVMLPRADIMAMPEDFTLEQAIGLIQRDGHSRYPVYRGQLDEIVGMVHIKDVFASVGTRYALRHEGDPAQAAVRRAVRAGARPAAADARRRASTWRWWSTNTAASTGW